jgi:hypothetical protein
MRAAVRALVAVVVPAVVVACGAPPEPVEEPPHGYVAGAEETAEAQPRLVVAGDGVVRVLDLVTEEVHEVARVDATSLDGDGRHAYVGAADGSVRVVDSGSWKVDHGDHVHYYRAVAREVGAVPGPGPAAAHGDPAVTALALADGTVRLLDRAGLDEGAVTELAAIPLPGPAVPYGGHLLVAAEQVAVHDRAGAQVATIGEPCAQPEGVAMTRRGAVFGCADGALLVTESGGAFRGEKIPYPRPDVERARAFHHRPGSATLAAAAGETGVWVLDVAERTWTLHETGPVVAVGTAGAGTPLLTLTADGVLHALDPASGQELARNPLLAAPVAPGAAIEVDTSRAYVNDPATGVIHEIDYGDALRVARTFDLGGAVTHMVETGR